VSHTDPGLALAEAERLELFAVWMSLTEVNSRMSFCQALSNHAMRICLKNVAHARREALARRKTKSANDASQFQLTP
jgi:hypothetical protein